MSAAKIILPVWCPVCRERVEVECEVYHDPGCRYTKNGDGWPESFELSHLAETCPHCQTRTDTDEWCQAVDAAYADYEQPEDVDPEDR